MKRKKPAIDPALDWQRIAARNIRLCVLNRLRLANDIQAFDPVPSLERLVKIIARAHSRNFRKAQAAGKIRGGENA